MKLNELNINSLWDKKEKIALKWKALKINSKLKWNEIN